MPGSLHTSEPLFVFVSELLHNIAMQNNTGEMTSKVQKKSMGQSTQQGKNLLKKRPKVGGKNQ